MDIETVDILLVEDDPNDAELTIRSLKKNNLGHHLVHLNNGEEALEFLYSPDRRSLPKLILIDLKMPKVDGFDFLKKIKNDKEKKLVPVVVFSSSNEIRDIIKTYSLGANAYIVKPVDYDKFMEAIMHIGSFWLLLNKSPNYPL